MNTTLTDIALLCIELWTAGGIPDGHLPMEIELVEENIYVRTIYEPEIKKHIRYLLCANREL